MSRVALKAASTSVFVLLSLLCLASVPFYSGSGLGRTYSWRMEHGCLTVTHAPNVGNETFYIDVNTEGMRYTWEGRWSSSMDWQIRVPLWAPWLVCAAWTAWAWRKRRHRSGCSRCGYSRAGIAPDVPCPECGEPTERSPRSPGR